MADYELTLINQSDDVQNSTVMVFQKAPSRPVSLARTIPPGGSSKISFNNVEPNAQAYLVLGERPHLDGGEPPAGSVRLDLDLTHEYVIRRPEGRH
ncbi:hypothetical protein [Caulobacter endophyticus]|uniref:hypothetical protein n=1 Tax=Caulobacter endophyticus TaxID=2172652 RepID=UPI0024100511|nr:hypothetical protein [Caulobacter endophyticus]MDG2529719.1 hypothetical protein [Caulobacter endophyticus]